MAPLFEDMLHALRGAPHIIDIRNLGLMGAIEFAPRPGAPGARGYELFVRAFEAGLSVRMTGDIIAFSPPLIVSADQIARIGEIVSGIVATLE